jgi:P27 family predicted phage terminase small subunit
MPRTTKPAKLRLLNGQRVGRDSGGRVVKESPGFRRVAPEMPASLSPAAKEVWERVIEELDRLGIVKEGDADALACYCEAVVTWREATAQVRAEGSVVTNRTIRKDGTESEWKTRHPAAAVAEQAARTIRGFAGEFGLTPSSESNVAARAVADEDEDPFANSQAVSDE